MKRVESRIPDATRAALVESVAFNLAPFGVPRERVEAGVELICNGVNPGAKSEDRKLIYSGDEVARQFHVTRRAVELWASKGLLKRVCCGTGKRAVGYTAESVERLAAGGAE